MELLTVWNKQSIGLNEKCLLREDGKYIGVETGNVYAPKMDILLVGNTKQ